MKWESQSFWGPNLWATSWSVGCNFGKNRWGIQQPKSIFPTRILGHNVRDQNQIGAKRDKIINIPPNDDFITMHGGKMSAIWEMSTFFCNLKFGCIFGSCSPAQHDSNTIFAFPNCVRISRFSGKRFPGKKEHSTNKHCATSELPYKP